MDRKPIAVLGELFGILGVFLVCFYLLYTEMKSIDQRLEVRMAANEARTDRLYEMFIEIVKERK